MLFKLRSKKPNLARAIEAELEEMKIQIDWGQYFDPSTTSTKDATYRVRARKPHISLDRPRQHDTKPSTNYGRCDGARNGRVSPFVEVRVSILTRFRFNGIVVMQVILDV